MKARVITAAATLALATASVPPFILDHFGDSSGPPLIDVNTMVQHVNILTS
ncbi:MAG TPA: hypothetical protein VFV66_31500 [Nonomuraea sp.]|nr:hypothetical protein [Nonomuraea sp.]